MRGPLRLSRRIFATLGELRDSYLLLLIVVGVVFLFMKLPRWLLELCSRGGLPGLSPTYNRGTQYVQAMDFSQSRPNREARPTWVSWGESFNKMTGSIANLVEEENKRRRLENEISIAREVQNQLFFRAPCHRSRESKSKPIARPRVPSGGDYYDFIQLSPTHIAIAIADISGKGISAALLMASLQAALRQPDAGRRQRTPKYG